MSDLCLSKGFPPISSSHSQVLILGSMPGKVSLDAAQYYAHPRNVFWKIMFALFERRLESSYTELQTEKSPRLTGRREYEGKLQFLQQHKIALWDVLASGWRLGSLDSAIDDSSIVVNDFESFFVQHPNITRVYFNGAKAEQVFNRQVLKTEVLNAFTLKRLSYVRLPSTSPAHAAITFEAKLDVWRQITEGW